MGTQDRSKSDPEVVIVEEAASRTFGLAEWLAAVAGNVAGTSEPRWLAALPRQRWAPARYARRRVAAMASAVIALGIGTFIAVDGNDDAHGTGGNPSMAEAATIPRPSGTKAVSPVVSGNAPLCCWRDTDAADAVQPLVLNDSGPQAITAFEASYYVARDAGQARAVVSSDAAVPSIDQIQAGIDSVPPGTTYCVQIHPLESGQYLVELTEIRPGQAGMTWRQRISTIEIDGHAMITSIAAV
ncbi:hypothetical protein [Nocardia nepalensis]|uniref:hypothetical protein n=1 Tax=Nocardia nepalensis TaxID=3375448 RepID=UPI003B684CE4